MTITELVRLSVASDVDAATLRRARALPGLAEAWRAEFAKRLAG
jgi:hypothetical protein